MLGWLQWQGEKGYVSWVVYNIFLTPVLDWIHDCVRDWTRDWTREWYSALNTSSVWPNRRQGIIFMVRVGRWGDFASRADPSRGERSKVETLEWRLKSLFRCFCLSPYFWFPNSTPFWVLVVWSSSVWRGQKIQAMPGSALLRLS